MSLISPHTQYRISQIVKKLTKDHIHSYVNYSMCMHNGDYMLETSPIQHLGDDQIKEYFDSKLLASIDKLYVTKHRNEFFVYADQTFEPNLRFYGIVPAKLLIEDINSVNIFLDEQTKIGFEDAEITLNNIKEFILPYCDVFSDVNSTEISNCLVFLTQYLSTYHTEEFDITDWTVDNLFFDDIFIGYPGNNGYLKHCLEEYNKNSFNDKAHEYNLIKLNPD
jgi:hypothetical protein